MCIGGVCIKTKTDYYITRALYGALSCPLIRGDRSVDGGVMEKTRLMVIDDDQGACETLADVFTEKGFDLTTAGSGQEAIKSLERELVDVAIIDIKLPDMDGISLLKRIKAIDPELVCIIITGHSSLQNAIGAVTDNADGYFIKPVDIDALTRRVTELLYDLRIRRDLRESEERFRSLVDSATDAIVSMDSDGKIILWNKVAEEIFGYTKEDAVGMALTHIMPERFREDHIKGFKNFLTTGESVLIGSSVEITALRSDGTEFPIELSLATWKSKGSTYFTGIIRDIFDRKLAEEELKRSGEEFKKVFKKVEAAKEEWERTLDCIEHDIVMMADAQGRIKRCNRSLANYLSSSFEDILGSEWGGLLRVNDFKKHLGRDGSEELHHVESGRWFSLQTYPYRNPYKETESEAVGTVVILHDITVMKKMTDALEETNRELKATQATIIQQEKMASLGQLAAGVAHEINNPMSFISSNLATLSKYSDRLSEFIDIQDRAIGGDDTVELDKERKRLKVDHITGDLKDLIAESVDGAERIRKIVMDLKVFSRPDRVEETGYADIKECLESTISIVWNELKYKATLKKEYGELPQTKCYPQQLNQVFMNLLVNAAQSIEGQGEITIRTWRKGDSIYVSIADTGCGIPPENVGKLFDPFFTTKEIGKGTGLGLSISYDIVKRHNGDISVESELGKGTEFTITIPVVDGD